MLVVSTIFFIGALPSAGGQGQPVARLDGFAEDAVAVRLDEWDRGLLLLDGAKAAEAGDSFRALWNSHPDRLELLDACLQAERFLCHADSVLPRLENRAAGLKHRSGTADRFLVAAGLRRGGQFGAAARDFESLSQFVDEQGDPLSAVIAALLACRCLFETADRPTATQFRQDIQRELDVLPPHPRLQAEANLVVAILHYLADELADAEAILQSVCATAADHGYEAIRCEALNALGGVTTKQRRNVEAEHYYVEAVAAARRLGDPRRLPTVLCNLGYQETHHRRVERARRHLLEAEEVGRKWGYLRELGPIQSALGALAEVTGDRSEAVRRFCAAVDLSRRSGNSLAEIGARQRMAYNLTVMGKYAEARVHYETCLEHLAESGAQFILNWVLGGLAVTYHKLGYLDLAAEYYERARAVNMDFGDRMSATWCLNSLGLIYFARGDYRQALIADNEALLQYETIGDAEGAGQAHVSIAEVYFKLGDYYESLEHGRLALSIAEEKGAEELLRQATQVLASVYSKTGEVKKAEENCLSAIDIACRWSDQLGEIRALGDLAGHYLATGRKEEARHQLDIAMSLLSEEEHIHVRSRIYLLLGRAAESPAAAIPWVQQALTMAEAGGLPDREWKCLSDLGQYFLECGDLKQAGEFQRRAVELVESLRRRVGVDELRRHMLRPAILPYERLIEVHMAGAGNPAAAFATSERSRSRILAGRLYAALAHATESSLRTTDAEERNLSATIAYLQSHLQDGALSPGERDSLRRRVGRLEDEFSLLRLRWSEDEDFDAAMLYPAARSAEQLQAILGADEHLLSYFLGADVSWLFSVNTKRILAWRLPPRERIETAVRLFLHLQKPASGSTTQLPDDVLQTAQRELYALLIEPAAGDFDIGTKLIIAPDGLLHRLPFAFLSGQGRFLIENHEVFTVPSLQTLGYLRQRAELRSRADDGTGWKLLAVGCGGNDAGAITEVAGDSRRVHVFTDAPVATLLHVDEEARSLADLFDEAVILTGRAANETSIRSGIMADADVIHIAAHSYADEADVRRSHILLNRLDDGNDGLLAWHEIASLDLNASLVTLASCRSAGGVLSFGEGITGLTQAFLHAGGTCVLATLTDVPDQDAARVMDRFYRNLCRGMSASSALRQVQLEDLRVNGAVGGRLAGMGFVLIGDGAVAHSASFSYRRYPVLIGAVLLCLSIMLIFVMCHRRRKKV